MEKMIEDLLNRGYAYDTFREGNLFDSYDGLEADVDFWYGRYCEDVDAGVNDPDVGIVEYIAGKIDEEHPTENPEQFNSLMRWVREILPKIEKNWSVNIREAQIGGTMQYANGEASGRALAGDLANKGIRDITPGPNGRGQAEVDKTGVYVGVPMGPDKTAWANPVAAKNSMSPAAAARVDKFQKAYAAAPAKEKAAMQDWSPEKPDMSMNKNAQVVDNNTGTVMPTAAQPQAKSSILQKLGFKESLFEDILKVSKLNESCSNSEDCDESILDKDYFWLKTHGYWCIDFETEHGYHFSLYANDMDPSKWFGQLSKKNGGDGYNHSIYDIHSRSCYSDLGSYDRPDYGTPRETFERTPYRDEKIVSVQANKPSIDLGTAVEYGVTISIKKKLCRLSWKAAADQLYRREINKVLEPYGKKVDYRTEYPEVGDNWELVDKLVAEAVENIKAEKKAAAAAKRAAREGITEDKARLFECIINLQESSANMTANAIAKRLSSYDGTDNGAKELVDYISKVLGSAAVIGTEGLKNDLPGFYQNHKDVENMTLAAAAVRSKNTPNALKLYQRFAKQLNANVDPNAVAQAIQAAEKDQTLSLQQAQAQVQK